MINRDVFFTPVYLVTRPLQRPRVFCWFSESFCPCLVNQSGGLLFRSGWRVSTLQWLFTSSFTEGWISGLQLLSSFHIRPFFHLHLCWAPQLNNKRPTKMACSQNGRWDNPRISHSSQCASSPPSPSSLWTIHHHGLFWLWNELWSGERSQCNAGGTQIRRDHRVPEDLFWRAFGGAADGKSTVGIACKLGGTVFSENWLTSHMF